MNTHIRQCFGRTFSVLLGAALWGMLLDPMAGAISLSYADSPQAPSGPRSAHSKIDRALPGVQTGLLQEWKSDKVKLNDISYVLPPEALIETDGGHPLPISGGIEKRLRYPVPVQYWLDGNAITQMILSLGGRETVTPRN